MRASAAGSFEQMFALLAEDATLVVDVGPAGRRVGRIRNVGRPVHGAKRIAAFLAAVSRQGVGAASSVHECSLNGQPAIVRMRDGRPIAALLISVAEGRIRHVFVQADASRLTHVGPLQ